MYIYILFMRFQVFFSSCKQVKFAYEVFRRTRPGIPLMALYGKQKQMKRLGIYTDFAKKSIYIYVHVFVYMYGYGYGYVCVYVYRCNCVCMCSCVCCG